jgi:valyl-tRNA synthetase
VLDKHGRGMSKSKGNVVWADDLISKYNVDSFRYWVATASLGTDLPFKEKELVAGNRLITKLWNASRFVMMNLQDYKPKEISEKDITELIDKWLLVKLNKTINDVKNYYLGYDIPSGKKRFENFFWHTFCDNYLEIIKQRLYQGKKQEKKSAQHTLYHALLSILKLIAPVMPHVTEEIYQLFFRKFEKDKSIHITTWPNLIKLQGRNIEKIGDMAVEIISKVRQFKAHNHKSLKTEVNLKIEKDKLKMLKPLLADFQAVTNAKKIEEGNFEIQFL